MFDYNKNALLKHGIRFCVIIFFVLFFQMSGVISAEELKIGIGQLDDSLAQGLLLKNVHAYQEITFTKPKTWHLKGGSYLALTLHHSVELIPAKSFLLVYINDKQMTKIRLDKSNVETKTVKIPLPLNLYDYNTLKLEVEQHYVDVCEDPTDPSLWTRISPNTYFDFKYSVVQPVVDLKDYPYPLFDPLQYGVNKVNFVYPEISNEQTASINALGIISAGIAQKVKWRKLQFFATSPHREINNNLNTVIVGTPEENELIVKYAPAGGLKLAASGGHKVFIDKSGKPIDDKSGVIAFFKNPSNKNRALLLISGNTPEGVLLAAKSLSNESIVKALKGNIAFVNDYNPSRNSTGNIARYLHDKNITLSRLGYDENRKAVRIAPPPLKYYVRVMPNMSTTSTMLSFNMKYSYSPRLNDELSTAEVKFNDISLKSVKLGNPKGEKNKLLKVAIPAELVGTRNILEIDFHLFPVKYDYCKNWYDDDLWGEVHKDSFFTLPQEAKVIFPDLGLLNDGLYPYTTIQDLSNTVIILPDKPNRVTFQAMLNVIGALGKESYSDAGLNILTSIAPAIRESDISNRNIILIGTPFDNTLIRKLKDKLNLRFIDEFKELIPSNMDSKAILLYSKDQGLIEQYVSSFNKSKVITILYGQTEKAVLNASEVFAKAQLMKKIEDGSFYAIDNKEVNSIQMPEKKRVKTSISAQAAGGSSWVSHLWPPSGPIGWIIVAIMGFAALFIAMFIFRILGLLILGRKGNE